MTILKLLTAVLVAALIGSVSFAIKAQENNEKEKLEAKIPLRTNLDEPLARLRRMKLEEELILFTANNIETYFQSATRSAIDENEQTVRVSPPIIVPGLFALHDKSGEVLFYWGTETNLRNTLLQFKRGGKKSRRGRESCSEMAKSFSLFVTDRTLRPILLLNAELANYALTHNGDNPPCNMKDHYGRNNDLDKQTP